MVHTLAELARLVNGQVKGDDDCEINGVGSLQCAQAGEISFLQDAKQGKHLSRTKASVVILNEKYVQMCPVNALLVDKPDVAYAKIASLFDENPYAQQGIHPSAVIDPSSQVDASVTVGSHCSIGKNVIIEKDVIIAPNCVIGNDCRIGVGTILWPNITLYHKVQLGQRVIIHSGVIIGADGFGFANDNGKWIKISQLGGVIIGDDVEIGANTAIDRGAIENTVIEEGVKLDNLVQIAHNVVIGAHTAIAGCVGIAGSAHIGRYCMIGGHSVIAGHISIVDRVMITAYTAVSNSIKQPGIYSSGINAKPNAQWRRNLVRFHQLDQIALRLKALEKTVNSHHRESEIDIEAVGRENE